MASVVGMLSQLTGKIADGDSNYKTLSNCHFRTDFKVMTKPACVLNPRFFFSCNWNHTKNSSD